MKKHLLLLIALFAASLFVMAEMTIYVYKKDGTKVPYVASEVDSVGFTEVYLITFDANNGSGDVEVVKCVNGETIIIPKNDFNTINATFIEWNTLPDGTGFVYSEKSTLTPTMDMKLYAQWKINPTNGTANGYEYIDLGLPSGTLWATMNLGANSPEKVGNYYTWEGISIYESNTCNCGAYSIRTDNRTILELSDDRAYQIWGENWRIPTQQELNELITNCNWEWTVLNNVNGYKVSSKTNSNSIFLPITGSISQGSSQVSGQSSGFYWSSSIDLLTYGQDYPFMLFFGSSNIKLSYTSQRCDRKCIRPVINRGPLSIHIFDANGGVGSMEKINANHGDFISLPKNAFTRQGYEFVCWNTQPDGSGLTYKDEDMVSIYDGLKLYAQWCKLPTKNDYVDLGLPSGTKWAKMNIGAENSEDFGFYFAWGETYPKYSYNGYNYSYSKYPFRLLYDNDAAFMLWGNEWRMPTRSEFQELINNCTSEFITQNGVDGLQLTSKINNNTIFLPAVGRNGFLTDYSSGYYWSSDISINYTEYAYYFTFNYVPTLKLDSGSRYYGYAIRPVMK